MKLNLMLKGRIVQIFNTQADFAEALGIDATLISRYVMERRKLSPARAREWAVLLQIRKAEFEEYFGFSDDGSTDNGSINIDCKDLTG